jgi:hypothetical protein
MARKSVGVPMAISDADYHPNSMKHVGESVMNLGLVTNQKQRKLQFDDCIPEGFTSQTANGTAHATGTGNNYSPPYSWPEIEPKPAWPGGRSNRTGE